jgi:hydrogenase small subunit
LDIATQVCTNAYATIAAGTCAAYGGLPAAKGGITGAKSVSAAIPGLRLVNLSGCPLNTVNLVATIVYWITYKTMPATDSAGRPTFAYGSMIHNTCSCRSHYNAGEFVRAWGDEGHKQGWCLYQMGCNGRGTYSNCAKVLWNDGTTWPVGIGHNCLGCTQSGFWDTKTPFYVP